MLTGLGHDVKLIAPEAVRPCVKTGKRNDAADAAAICEAASRTGVRVVPVKSLEQQGILALHSARSLLVEQQTMLANAMRGLATEFGLAVADCLSTNAAHWMRASRRSERRSWPMPATTTPHAAWR